MTTAAIIRPRLRFDVYSHTVKITGFDMQGKAAIGRFCEPLVVWEQRREGFRIVNEMERIFAASTKDRQEYRFHRNQLADLFRQMEAYGINRSQIEVVEHPMYEPTAVEFDLKTEFPPRPEQVPVIEYLEQPPKEGYAPSKLVVLQTGKGKTFVTLTTLAKLKVRTAIVLKAMFIDQWIRDIHGDEDAVFHPLSKQELLVVRGTKDLIKLIKLAQSGELEAKIIILSIDTMRSYMLAHDTFNGDMSLYGCGPTEFWETLGVGVRVVDEAHLDFHCVFRMDLYTHIPLTISLSATMVADSEFLNEMYRVAWPLVTRSPKVPHHKYIKVKNLWYSVDDPKKVRCQNWKKQYSHVMYEQSIMKNKTMLSNYIDMALDIMRGIYFNDAEPGQKGFLFCATQELCTIMRDEMQREFPEKIIGRFISGDSRADVAKSDVTVTTLKSGGTAIDVRNLTRVLCTHNVSSKQANEQAVGRLRPVKDWPEMSPEFYFISARNIDKHCRYAQEKSHKLDGKVLSYQDFETRYRI